MTGKPKRAALYVRVSTDGQTVDNQRLALEAVCKQRGWQVDCSTLLVRSFRRSIKFRHYCPAKS